MFKPIFLADIDWDQWARRLKITIQIIQHNLCTFHAFKRCRFSPRRVVLERVVPQIKSIHSKNVPRKPASFMQPWHCVSSRVCFATITPLLTQQHMSQTPVASTMLVCLCPTSIKLKAQFAMIQRTRMLSEYQKISQTGA